MRAGHNFTVGVSGAPIPDAPRVADPSWGAEVLAHFYDYLTNEQRASPEWDPENPENMERYEAEFRRLHAQRWNR